MSSNSDDIQAAGSDTHPPMLDRTDYDSCSQRIRLYSRGKENGIYILQSIDHGPFKLGATRDTLGTTPKGGVLLGPERPRTYDDLNDNEKKRFDADVHATYIVLQGLPKDIYKLTNYNIEAKAIWDNIKMLHARSELTKEDRESQLYEEFERFKMLLCENINEYYSNSPSDKQPTSNLFQHSKPSNNSGWSGYGSECSRASESESEELCSGKWYSWQWGSIVLDEEELLFLTGEQTNQFDVDVDDHPVRDLALNDDNIFQADECDAFDSDVDDEPTTQSLFMANLSSAGQTNQQAGPSNASILSEVHDLENAIDLYDDNQDEHEIHNEVQQKIFLTQLGIIWPTKLHEQDAETAIGVQNPFYLKQAKRTQPTLYDGNELLKPHHVSVLVTSSEEDLDLAETTRIKMNEKMNDHFFENLEAKVDQNAIDLKSGEIEQKNLLIINENLIANCISHDVFFTVTDSAMAASRFHELSTAYTVAMNHAVELEVENSKLLEKIKNDDHDTMVKAFSKLEVAHLNLELKHQHLKENIENFKSKSSKDVPEFNAFFELDIRDDQIQVHKTLSRNNRVVYHGYLNHLTDTLDTLREELLENVSASCPKSDNKRDTVIATIPVTRKRHVTFADPFETSGKNPPKIVKQHTVQKTNILIVHSTGVSNDIKASRSQLESNTTHDRTLPANSVFEKKVEDHHRTNKSKLSKKNRVDSSTSVRRTVVQTVLRYLDSGCSKHMIRDRSRLKNFMKKFIRTVRFGNDHFGAIMGYGDYVLGDSVISSVYYVEGLGHNLFSVGQFCDSVLEVAFKNTHVSSEI
nr:integrase, catalytic region, zinc finger, CCHC-type, peptidase aspartic, catalytic [Tanacetum cinerariifolium]